MQGQWHRDRTYGSKYADNDPQDTRSDLEGSWLSALPRFLPLRLFLCFFVARTLRTFIRFALDTTVSHTIQNNDRLNATDSCQPWLLSSLLPLRLSVLDFTTCRVTLKKSKQPLFTVGKDKHNDTMSHSVGCTSESLRLALPLLGVIFLVMYTLRLQLVHVDSYNPLLGGWIRTVLFCFLAFLYQHGLKT